MREVLVVSSLAILSPFALQATEELGTMPFASKMGCCKPEKVEECKPCKPCCKPVTCCVRKEEPCPECVCNVHGTMAVKTNLAYISHNGFILTGDFLWWQAQEDGLAPVNQVSTVANSSGIFTKSKKKNLHFRWSPGFRVGAGARFGDDGWDLYTNWTRFYTHANRSVKVALPNTVSLTPPFGPSTYLTESWLDGLLGTPFTTHAHWKLRYNTVDLEFGRHFFLSKRLSVRPHFGLRGAFINQRYRINYQDVLLETGAVLPNTRMHARNNFNGVGLRLGSDIQFHFARHWNLFAAISASAIEGHFELKQKFNTAFATGIAPLTSETGKFTYKNNFWALRANLEESFGLQWETFFNCDKSHVAVSLLYEFGQWFQQNELSAIHFDQIPALNTGAGDFGAIDADTEKHGNLNLQGATVRVEFKF